MLQFTTQLDWIPIIYFAQGAVYLAPNDTEIPDLETLQKEVWRQIKAVLSNQMKTGEIGFKRDGKGLKVAPQTLELFTASDLILTLPDVISATVKNEKDPATKKRLEKLELTESEQDLFNYADLRSDRLAEFIILAQKEFFSTVETYPNFVLQSLNLADKIPVEKTQIQAGGVNYGWYYVASYYISNNRTLDYQQTQEAIIQLAENLAEWAENNNLLSENISPTKQIFFDYLKQYLDLSDGDLQLPNFAQELENYTIAKAKNKAICSLSSGEFLAEEQMDSVVLFKPQQYSNKNALGGGKIKRGISKIWALEMLLRQARWSGKDKQVSKLEENKPVFLYIFPAYVYSPEIIKAVRRLINSELIDINLWDAKKCWIDGDMKPEALQNIAWLEPEESEEQNNPKYSNIDLPFMATTYTKTRGKTDSDAWVKPAFLALALPQLLGVKVVATSSPDPLYGSDQEFLETVKLDGVASFWNLLGLDTNLRLQDIDSALTKLLIIYTIHLDNRSSPPDSRWQALNSTVREVMTDVLNVFSIANEKLREDKREASPNEVKRYCRFAQIFAQGDATMTEKLKITKELVHQYRTFYQVNLSESSHSILLPLSKALEIILSTPEHLDNEELILQGSGQLYDALDRQEIYKRPLLKKDENIPYEIRKQNEIQAIHQFMTTCVEKLFGELYKGDRALLQENRNRIKSGAEFAYRLLQLSVNSNQ